MAKPTLDTYGGATMIAGFAGEIVNSNDATTIVSCTNEAATAIDFGVAVTRGVATGAGATENVKVLNTNGQIPYGISVRNASPLIATTDGNNTINYARYSTLPVLKVGEIYCVPVEDVVAGDGVVALPASAGGLGGTTAGAANGTSRMAFSGATWRTTTTTASGNPGVVFIGNFI